MSALPALTGGRRWGSDFVWLFVDLVVGQTWIVLAGPEGAVISGAGLVITLSGLYPNPARPM